MKDKPSFLKKMNDNRNYTYTSHKVSTREEFKYIIEWIKPKSSVIDLGCGEGSLLLMLNQQRGIKKAHGIEISKSGVLASKRKGFDVWQGRIDVPLSKIRNKSYDFAICNVTLQMVMYPEVLISEMKRISHKQIISFPNFAFILNRIELLLHGRMPETMIPGYKWYSTGHIHQLSILDFVDFCRNNQIEILDQRYILPNRCLFIPKQILSLFPNLFTITALFLTSEK